MVEQAWLVGISLPENTDEETEGLLLELEELTHTLGIHVAGRQAVRLKKPQAKFLVGSGKMEDIVEEARAHHCDVIIFDVELTPGQQRNWERETKDLLIIDRQEVILDIFAGRAQTKEATLQVELARLEYNLPRLQRAWTHLNRQRGGGAVQRDAGETQLEMDQRMVRTQIARTKRQLVDVVQHREVQRKQRMKVPVPSVAIVGYTNAGKSSLLNAMTGSRVLAEDKLFATLDPTSRRLELPTGQQLVATDTVGFVRKLPHRLVEAFKATLEEAIVADFLLHVLDVSNPDFLEHQKTTLAVLKELGAEEKQILTLFNKCDKLHREPERLAGLKKQHPEALFISAAKGVGLEALYQRISTELEGVYTPVELLIPHHRYDVVAQIHREGTISKEEPEAEGTYVLGKIPQRLQGLVEPFLKNGG